MSMEIELSEFIMKLHCGLLRGQSSLRVNLRFAERLSCYWQAIETLPVGKHIADLADESHKIAVFCARPPTVMLHVLDLMDAGIVR